MHNNENKQGFVTPTGLPGEAIVSFSGYGRSYIGGLAKVLFRCKAIFFNCFALCGKLLRLPSPGKWPRLCVAWYTSASSLCSCNFRVTRKISQSNFLRKVLIKHGFLKIFCFQIRFSYRPICQLLEPYLAALWRLLPNISWLWLTFEMTNIFFWLIFVLSQDSYLEPPPLSLLVVLSGFCYMLSGIA